MNDTDRIDYLAKHIFCLAFNYEPSVLVYGDGVISRPFRQVIDDEMRAAAERNDAGL